MNWSLVDFLSHNPKWFIAIWVALIVFSLRLVWEYMEDNR